MRKQPPANRASGFGARSRTDPRQDPYAAECKPAGVAVCTTCRATQHRGRWTWEQAAPGALTVLCPACRRVADRCPAHVLRVDGVPRDRRAELIALVQRLSEEEKREHPLERLMAIVEGVDRIEITTTGVQLPRRLRAAIGRAFRNRFATEADADHSSMTWKAAAAS